MKFCERCHKQLTSEQRHNTYCSKECAILAAKEKKINDWLNGSFDAIKGKDQLSKTIRDYLIQKSNYSCELCGWNKINPVTQKCPLEIHHIDGDYRNNQQDNLQVLCPNCHSLTDNYKALNSSGREDRVENRKNYCVDCGKEIGSKSLRCRDCSDKNRITEKPLTREELKMKIRTMPFTKIGEEQGVTDNAVRKWCKSYNLPSKKKDIALYSEEEWELL